MSSVGAVLFAPDQIISCDAVSRQRRGKRIPERSVFHLDRRHFIGCEEGVEPVLFGDRPEFFREFILIFRKAVEQSERVVEAVPVPLDIFFFICSADMILEVDVVRVFHDFISSRNGAAVHRIRGYFSGKARFADVPVKQKRHCVQREPFAADVKQSPRIAGYEFFHVIECLLPCEKPFRGQVADTARIGEPSDECGVRKSEPVEFIIEFAHFRRGFAVNCRHVLVDFLVDVESGIAVKTADHVGDQPAECRIAGPRKNGVVAEYLRDMVFPVELNVIQDSSRVAEKRKRNHGASVSRRIEIRRHAL